ncbi:hypothetical protein [Peterkaempfera bronchialis]|nr:hypothetical protein [Peterkaempfera bronchialis]
MATTWALPRAVRAVVFSVLCVALAAAAHVCMAPVTLPATVLATAFAATAGLTWLLVGSRWGPLASCGWMTGAQLGLHTLFEYAAPMGHHGATGTGCPSALGAGRAEHAMHAMHGMGAMQGMSPMAGMPGVPTGVMAGTAACPLGAGADGPVGHAATSGGMSGGMFVAHLVAALCCALLLHRGEAALTAVVGLLHALALAFVLLLLTPPPRPLARAVGGGRMPRTARRPQLLLLTHAVVRRGPPVVRTV